MALICEPALALPKHGISQIDLFMALHEHSADQDGTIGGRFSHIARRVEIRDLPLALGQEVPSPW